MNCLYIKNLIPDYIDRELNLQEAGMVKGHLDVCKKCKKELVFLKKYKKEMKSLYFIKAPKNFLEMVHRGIEKDSFFKRVKDFLFVPFNVKLPLEAAGILVTSAILFFLLPSLPNKITPVHLVETEKKVAKEEAGTGRRSGKVESDIKIAAKITGKDKIQKTKYIAMNKDIKRKRSEEMSEMAGIADKINPGENKNPNLLNFKIAIIMKRNMPLRRNISPGGRSGKVSSKIFKAPAAEMEDLDEDKSVFKKAIRKKEKKPRVKKDKEYGAKKMKGAATPGQERVLYSDEPVEKIKDAVKKFKGKIVKKIYYSNTGELQYIILEIPVKNYNAFITGLNRVGKIRKQNMINPVRKQKMVNFKLEMLLEKTIK